VVLKIAIEKMEHGDETAKRLRGERSVGLPWIAILDSAGVKLATSDGPNGNIGCPISADERAVFIEMISKTLQHAPADRVAEIAKVLEEHARKRSH